MQDQQMGLTKEQWKHEADMISLKALEDRNTKVQVATISAMGFDTDKDEDDDGVPDVLEVAKFGVDADIKQQKLLQDSDSLELDKQKFEHQKVIDKQKVENDRKKIEISKTKGSNK